MTLKEFMKTDAYKMADCIEYVDGSGMEVEYDNSLLDLSVGNYHNLSGFLEIELNKK